MESRDYEFYPTPAPFTRWLFLELPQIGRTIFEPCVGDGALIRAAESVRRQGLPARWLTNDLDPRWPAMWHLDAAGAALWREVRGSNHGIDWTVTNPPFSTAIQIIERALVYSRVGLAMHLRSSIHEVLKLGTRRTWMARHPPSGILWLPRWSYQKNKRTGKWTTDSCCSAWVIWMKTPSAHQFIRYAPEWVLDELAGLQRERQAAERHAA